MEVRIRGTLNDNAERSPRWISLSLSLSLVRRARIRESFTRPSTSKHRDIVFPGVGSWLLSASVAVFSGHVPTISAGGYCYLRLPNWIFHVARYNRARCCALSCVKLLSYDVESSHCIFHCIIVNGFSFSFFVLRNRRTSREIKYELRIFGRWMKLELDF